MNMRTWRIVKLLDWFRQWWHYDPKIAKVADWVENADFETLERRILELPPATKEKCLRWAMKEYHSSDMPLNYPKAKMKWAVAVIGTLAPEELYDDDNVLDAKTLEM